MDFQQQQLLTSSNAAAVAAPRGNLLLGWFLLCLLEVSREQNTSMG
jgi:hypothetical protein